jgi:hypothetical protein
MVGGPSRTLTGPQIFTLVVAKNRRYPARYVRVPPHGAARRLCRPGVLRHHWPCRTGRPGSRTALAEEKLSLLFLFLFAGAPEDALHPVIALVTGVLE